jgi:DNA mismatch endonuclease (patch repair protein)
MNADRLTPEQRSEHMRRIRGKGAKSTESIVRAALQVEEAPAWAEHSSDIIGRPDFYFPSIRLAIFVDGCFWHGCPECRRNTPNTRTEFWTKKIEANRRRDRLVTRSLRAEGIHVMRIWEHSLTSQAWRSRLRAMITRCMALEGSM